MTPHEPNPPGLAADTVRERLAAELPGWTFEGGWLRRTFRTQGWKATLMVVNAVGWLAEAGWHHPDLTVSYAFVTVKLKTHAARADGADGTQITGRDFALARKIDEVVDWQPGRETPASLEGTPDDARHRLLRRDAPAA